MQQRADGRIFVGIFFLLAAVAAGPAAASSARLLAPGGLCLGVAGAVGEGAAVRLEACDGRAGQRWQMPPRGFSGLVGIGGLCLDGASLSLAVCYPAGEYHDWRHDSDGWLVVGPFGDRCLDAAVGLGIAPCSGEASQRFVAQGDDAWTPAVATGAASFLPIPTSNPNIWYGRSNTAQLRSENGGRSFVPLRAAAASDAFAVSPFDPNLLWFNSRSFLERSRDGGRSWTPVAHLPASVVGVSQEIVPSTIAAERVYAYGLSELWASRDGGSTFARRGALPRPKLGKTQLLDLGEGQLLFLRNVHCLVGCEPENVGVWRSSDDGASWQQVVSRESALDAVQLVQDPHHPDDVKLLFRPTGDDIASVLASSDGGRTFAPFGQLPSRDGRLFYDPEIPNALYLIEAALLWRSLDGSQWQPLASPAGEFGGYAIELSLFGGGRLRVAALRQGPTASEAAFFDSEDGGDSFVRLDPAGNGNPSPDPLPVAFTGRPGTLYYLDGVLLLRSDDGGASWQRRARLIDAEQIAADPRDPDRVFARLRSGGLRLSEDGGATFVAVGGPAGDASAFVVYAEGERTVVLAAGLSGFHRSLDGGRHFTALTSPRPGERFQKLVANELVIFAVGQHDDLFRSYDDGETWERLNVAEKTLQFGSGLLAYARAHEPTIRVSDDGGATFVDRHPPEVLGGVTGVSIDERNNIYVAGATTALRSSDRGRTWQSLGRDLLPGNGNSYSVVADPFEEGKLYHSGALGLHLGRFSKTPPLDLGSRFEARVTWTDYLGQTGHGVAQALTRDSGLFWLFTAGRAEVSVKVLDGRAINGKFWVFLASMTDVELHLEVEDRVTGEVWSYHNPLGRLLSFGDIAAFPRATDDPAVAAPSPIGGLLTGTAQQVVIADRFEVEVDWNAAGQSGNGQGRRLNSESAAFCFFDPANVELIVNVLDGRPINGKFWVYFGSMSDVAYTLRIKDRVSGQVKTYANPAGSFASRGDTEAFE